MKFICLRSIIAFIWTCSTLNNFYVSAGVLCYKCDHLPHARDCDRIVECGDNENCYGEKFVSDDGLVTFNTGCRAKDRCGLQKRDTSLCALCCDSDYCNLETCDVPVTSNRKRCLSCKYSVRPEDCNLSLLCNEDEYCYTQAIIHNGEKRYRLSCVHKNQCGTLANLDIANVGIGKRAATDEYCGKCCSGNNCNRVVCGQNFTEPSSNLEVPPLQTFCRDNSTSFCRSKLTANPDLCKEDYYKFYLCPFTCQQCDTFPVITAAPITAPPETTSMTTLPPTTVPATLAPNVCDDLPGATCNNLTCLISDVANNICRKFCGLCSDTTTEKPTTVQQTAATVPDTTTEKPTTVQQTTATVPDTTTEKPTAVQQTAATAPGTTTEKPTTVQQTAATAPATLAPNVCADEPSATCNYIICNFTELAEKVCRKTCGLCSGQQNTTATTQVTIDACEDVPGTDCTNCFDFFLANTACRRTCGNCPATTTPTTAAPTTQTPKTTTISTTTAPVCLDPIKECQCKYLDDEANICTEAELDHRLKRFCCYYCQRKKGDNTCPDAQCDRLEKPEQDKVDAMTNGITCIKGK